MAMLLEASDQSRYSTMGYVDQREWKPTARRGPISAEFHSPGPASVTLPSYFGLEPVKHLADSSDIWSACEPADKRVAYECRWLCHDSQLETPFYARTPPPVGAKHGGGPQTQHFDSKKANSPSYSMGARIIEKPKIIGPGPVYDVSNMKPQGGKCAIPVAKLPPKDKEDYHGEKFVTPGPSAYDVAKADKQIYKSNPSWPIRDEQIGANPNKEPVLTAQKGRVFNEVPVAPGPVYDLPSLVGTKSGVFLSNKSNSPAYSLASRPKDPKPNPIPGPGSYKIVETEAYKNKSPQYSLSSRTQMPKDKTKIPGPGVYSPEKAVIDTPPRFSFGIRHSPYLGNFKEI
ncbi:unnamed protein product [Notodromas monacha]|uniref:Outer dense fiber protein 3 n=1 Tax=Notodromas monacha TaxID=399045 RepID=A0A7R9BSR8_9CRUS|nr:unnamed protein product [Notodromas monacha]CAG0921053.1 unnamed protein product [Notodromas monacha]